MQTEFSAHPPPLVLHSSISSHTLKQRREALGLHRDLLCWVIAWGGLMNDLFVGSSVSEAPALDLRPAIPRRTRATAETRGRVDAAHAHVTGLHATLVHVAAVGPVALHPIRTGAALSTLGGHRTLHPQVARVRQAGRPRLHPPHP